MSVQDTTTLDSSAPGTTGVVLSDPAAAKVKALLDQEGRDDLRLRIAVQPGGCSGLRYQLFFDERFLDGDQTYEFGGVEVIVDRMSGPYLGGAIIDFVDTIEKQGFTIDNPNARRLLRLRRQLQLSSPARSRERSNHVRPGIASIPGLTGSTAQSRTG